MVPIFCICFYIVILLFFSQQNIDALQIGLKNMVANKTNGKHIIHPQSVTELSIIMRSMYLQYGLNLETNIVEQVKDLNQKVLDFAVPRILVDLEQYDKYNLGNLVFLYSIRQDAMQLLLIFATGHFPCALESGHITNY